MKKTKAMAAILLSALLVAATGCATLPTPEVMKAEVATYQLPKLPEPGKAIVYVVRPSIVGGLIRFNVFVDDKEVASEVGFTRGGQYIYFDLAPGEHTILSKAENWAETSVKAAAGDIIYIQQDPAFGLVIARNSVFKIEDYQGKYQVKQLTLGTLLRAEKGGAEGSIASLPPVSTSEQPAPARSATTTTTTPTLAGSERQLTAAEVQSHVANLKSVNATLSSGAPIRVEFTWGNGFSMSTTQGLAERVSGVRQVEGNRVCLRPIAVGAALTRMSGLQVFANKDCYALYQSGTASYLWKAQSPVSTSGPMLSYSLP